MVEETFQSAPIALAPGQLFFEKRVLPMPNGSFAITAFHSQQVVDAASGQPVPINHVYSHWHLLLNDKNGSRHTNPLCHQHSDQVLEATPEARLAPVDLPPGYGYVVPADGRFQATVHLIRTQVKDVTNDGIIYIYIIYIYIYMCVCVCVCV